MEWIFLETKQQTFLSPSKQPFFLSEPPPPPQISNLQQPNGFSLNNKVSPSILLIIVILAIIFFVSGLLHLLVRFMLRPPVRDPDDLDNVTALQGQLQQLFHLHDAGVDQSFIDTLPIFNYKAIIGLKDPFDCAVCLCEFEGEDKLRLLPKCSHAFHMECIDTWLLSHSTCPLCRASLVPDFSPNNSCSPIVLVLESGSSESSREIVSDFGTNNLNLSARANSHLGFQFEEELGSTRVDFPRKSCEIQVKSDGNEEKKMVEGEEKVVSIKLGKFRNVDGGGENEGTSSSSVDARRCFSMGSFQYVMDENSKLQVPIRTPLKKQPSKKPNLPLNPGHRPAISECDCDSTRGFNGFEAFKGGEMGNGIGRSKRESFSVSKIWLRGNKSNADCDRRAFSFRFPVRQSGFSGEKSGGRASSEIGVGRWDCGGSELGCDEEIERCNSLECEAKTPSFARRTLLWLVGRQNKVVHSSFSPNV